MTEALSSLYMRYSNHFHSQPYVWGNGNATGGIVLIGEAPGKDEVREGLPFVGQAGKQLEAFLHVLLLRRQDIFITNAIKYRLCEYNEKTGKLRNRPALMREIEESRPFLLEELVLLNPRLVITLGNVPLLSVTGDKKHKIGSVHGMPLPLSSQKFTLFPLYHPASLIYNRSLRAIYEQDLIHLKEFLHN